MPFTHTIPLVKGRTLLESLAHIFNIRVRVGIGKFWKVMEINNAISQDLESVLHGFGSLVI